MYVSPYRLLLNLPNVLCRKQKALQGLCSAYSICLVGLFFFSAEPPFGLPLSIFEPSGLL